jgi:hypothetical protein
MHMTTKQVSDDRSGTQWQESIENIMINTSETCFVPVPSSKESKVRVRDSPSYWPLAANLGIASLTEQKGPACGSVKSDRPERT